MNLKIIALPIISKQKIQEFIDYLGKLYLLGLQHDVGKIIMSLIETQPRNTIIDKIYYRARPFASVSPDIVYLGPPKQGISILPGRWNLFGESVGYFSESHKVAFKELTGSNPAPTWVARFQINTDNILNLTEGPLSLLHEFHCQSRSKECKTTISEYKLFQFIKDVALLNSFKGVIYPTRFGGNSLVLFDCNDSNAYKLVGLDIMDNETNYTPWPLELNSALG